MSMDITADKIMEADHWLLTKGEGRTDEFKYTIK